MIKDYFSLAISDLKHRGLRSLLTILGIFIGIAAVVSLITLSSGLERAITGQFGGLSLETLTVQNKQAGFAPPGSGVIEKLTSNDLEIIEKNYGVRGVVTRLIRVTNMEYNDQLRFIYIADLPDTREGVEVVYESVGDLEADKGRLLKLEDRSKVMIGRDLAKEDTFGKKISIGNRVRINGKSFEVVGILKPTSTFVINGAVMMPHEDMKELLDIEDEIDLIIVRVGSEDIQKTAGEIERALRKDRDEDLGEESFVVETPLQAIESVNDILNVVNIIVVGIAAISLFVGGVGIANTMYTSVLERTKDIGIMKAVGAKNKDVLMIFIIESGMLGLIGGIIGAIMGLGIAIGASEIANQALGLNLLAVETSWPLLAGAAGFSFLVGVASGVLPALQASKLNVVDALRH